MTKQETKQIKDVFYKNIFMNINHILGNKSGSSASAGLFLRLPVNLQLVEQEELEAKPSKKTTAEEWVSTFAAYVVLDEGININIDIFYDSKTKANDVIELIIAHKESFALIYFHELTHIVRMHNTHPFNNMMKNILKNTGAKLDEQQSHSLIVAAEDYAINYAIQQYVNDSLKSSHFFSIGLCDEKYSNMSEQSILKKMVEDNETNNSTNKFGKGDYESTTSNGKLVKISKPSKSSIVSGSQSKEIASTADMKALADSITEHIKEVDRNIGNDTNSTDELFNSTPVELNWFKRLKLSLDKEVLYKTNKSYVSWAGFNNKFRHIFKSPKHIQVDAKISIILAIDQSGSVSTEELSKLLSIIEINSKKIYKMTVLLHDTEIVKTFVIKNRADIAKDKNFKEALSKRHARGGTSHKCIFDWLQNNLKRKELSESIFISYSDFYSDVEPLLPKYNIFNQLKTYWVRSSDSSYSLIVPNGEVIETS